MSAGMDSELDLGLAPVERVKVGQASTPPNVGPPPSEAPEEPTPVTAEDIEDAPAKPDSTVKPEASRNEVERIDPEPLEKVLESGTHFDLEALRLRQFLRLLRIVTRGASGILDQTDLDFEDPQAFAQNFLGMVLFAIPEAEEETIDFIKSMVKPVNLTGDPKKDLIKHGDLAAELDNPALEDVITIVQCVIENEAEDLRALGKRLGAMFQTAQRLGATAAPTT